MTILKTDRLILRPLEMGDAQAVATQIAEWEVMRWLTTPPWPYRLQDAEDYIGSGNAAHSFAITKDGVVCGVAGISDELGYWLGKDHWGQGIMTEAARAVVAHHFESGADGLGSGYLLDNGPSKNVLTKLGFEQTKVVRKPSAPLGREVEIQQVFLLAERWSQINDL